MRPLIISAALIALAACGKSEPGQTDAPPETAAKAAEGLVLGADGVPTIRPGLWETVKTDGGETETRKECVGPESNAELRQMLTREVPECRVVQRSANPAGVKMVTECVQQGVKIDTTFTMTGVETAYDMRLGMYVTTPDGARNGGEIVTKSRWIGACPAGVKPGQTLEP